MHEVIICEKSANYVVITLKKVNKLLKKFKDNTCLSDEEYRKIAK